MLDLTDDYLAAEPSLVAILNTVDGLRKVYTSVDLAEIKQRTQVTPAAHVIYGGNTIESSAPGGIVSHETQTWYIVLAINLLDKKLTAGPLLAKLIKALSGHQSALGPMIRVNAPKPYFTAGFGYYPLAYKVTFRNKGART